MIYYLFFRIDEKGRKHRAARGRDIIIPVPVGTSLSRDDGRIIGELEEIGSKIVVAQGGRGGSAATVNWCGEKGERNIVRLEMRLHSDIALVGYVIMCYTSCFIKMQTAVSICYDTFPFTTYGFYNIAGYHLYRVAAQYR